MNGWQTAVLWVQVCGRPTDRLTDTCLSRKGARLEILAEVEWKLATHLIAPHATVNICLGTVIVTLSRSRVSL